MNIYKIEQDDVKGWDTHDSAVVVAENEEQAKRIHPAANKRDFGPLKEEWWIEDEHSALWGCDSWTHDLDKIKVTLIGKAEKSFDKPQVIVASYNAG